MATVSTLGRGCALAAWAFVSAAFGQAPADINRPQAAGRLVRVFNFEERDTNPGEVPELWFRAQDDPQGERRAGFPAWNMGTVVYRQDGATPFAGDGVVCLPTRGGSTSLMLGSGAVPVFSNADYRVSVKVRTSGLSHAGAAIVATLLDDSGKEVPGSEVRAGPVRAEKDWGTLAVEVIGRGGAAAWLQIELLLLQPEQAALGEPGAPHQVWAQDHSGQAFFDDLLVLQLPRVEIVPSSPGGVVVSPEVPRVTVQVRDLTGEKLTVVSEALDAQGRVVDSGEHAGGSGLITMSWQPKLPRLGWYRVRVRVKAGERMVDEAHTDLVWVGGATASTSGEAHSPFGLALDDIPDEALALTPVLARRTGAGSVTIPLWTSAMQPAHAAARAGVLSDIVAGLLGEWREVTLSFPESPAALAHTERLDPQDPLGALLIDVRTWGVYAAPAMEKLGPRVQRWQVGRAGSDAAFWRSGLTADITAASKAIATLAPGPRVSVGGRIDRAWPKGVPEVALLVPSDLEPEGVRLACESLAGQAQNETEARLVFEPMPTGSPTNTVPHLARQVIEAWVGMGEKAGAAPVLLANGWDWVGERRPQLMPRPEVAAWRTLSTQLGRRRVVGEFPIGPGVRCYLLAPVTGAGEEQGAAMVAWNESAPGEAAVVTDFLGDGPLTVTDIWGNTSAAPEGAKTTTGRPPGVRVALTSSPVFIEGIDLPWCRFVAGLRIDPPSLETTGQQQERRVVMTNSWKSAMSGTITVLEPGGTANGERDRTWRISPRTGRFQSAAGEDATLNLSIGFSAVEESGPREFVFEVEVQADRTYGPVTVRRLVQIGTPGLRMDITARVVDGDVLADAVIRNTGSSPVSLRMTAFAPGSPRSKATIQDLAAGHQTTKRFRFPDAARLRGQRVVVSIEDPETGARLVGSAEVR